MDAEKYYKRGLEIKKKHFGKTHFETAVTLNNLGYLYFRLDELDKALDHCEEALKIQEKHYGMEHFLIVETLLNLCRVFIKLGILDKAKEYSDRAKVICEHEPGGKQYLPAIGGLLQQITMGITLDSNRPKPRL